MKQYRATCIKNYKAKKQRLSLRYNQRISGFRLYWGFILSGEQYTRILSASVKACREEIQNAKKEDCEEFIKAGGGLVLLSSFVIMLRTYEAEQYPDYYGALQFFTKIAENRIEKDFLRTFRTSTGKEARICNDDQQSLASDLVWNNGVWGTGFIKAMEWYTPPEAAKVIVNYITLSESLEAATIEGNQEIIDAVMKRAAELNILLPNRPPEAPTAEKEELTGKEKTQFGNREEIKLFPGRERSKRERERQGIRSTALSHFAVLSAKVNGITYKTPRLRTFAEAFDEATPTLFANDELLPASAKAATEPIPNEVYGYVAALFTDAVDNLKAGGDGHVKRDIYAFCDTFGLKYSAKSAPDIAKAFEQISRVSFDFGDNKIRGGELSFAFDINKGIIDFKSATLNEVYAKIREHHTEVLKDPRKEFAPKNLKAELFRQKDIEAKNAIWQVIAPGFELRGLYKRKKNSFRDDYSVLKDYSIDYDIKYRTIINETDGFSEALNEARKKSRGFDSKFLKRKLKCIIDYLMKYTEYPQRYKDFNVIAIQPRGATIQDSVLHLVHNGLNSPVFEDSEASGADAK